MSLTTSAAQEEVEFLQADRVALELLAEEGFHAKGGVIAGWPAIAAAGRWMPAALQRCAAALTLFAQEEVLDRRAGALRALGVAGMQFGHARRAASSASGPGQRFQHGVHVLAARQQLAGAGQSRLRAIRRPAR
jgi:hypothetical protein